jgi:hypothetical protein
MNILPATINSILTSKELSCVNTAIEDDIFSLFLVEVMDEEHYIHSNVKLAFKETEVILLKSLAATSANIASAVIEKIEHGAVMTQVSLLYKRWQIKSLVATPLFEALHVSQNDTVFWMVQPSEISLLWSSDHGI